MQPQETCGIVMAQPQKAKSGYPLFHLQKHADEVFCRSRFGKTDAKENGKMKKRIVSLLLSLLLLISVVPISVSAEGNYVAWIGTKGYETLDDAIKEAHYIFEKVRNNEL